MAQVTSYDVAARAGVSQSAVSRTFSANGKVSASTREKVLKAASELGYQPNLLARSLITGKTNMVAVLASQTTGRFYPEVIQYLASALDRAGKKMLLFYTDGKIERVDDVLNEVGRYQVDGIITSTQFAPDRRELIRGLNTPMVLLNRQDPADEFPSVICDQNQGGAAWRLICWRPVAVALQFWVAFKTTTWRGIACSGVWMAWAVPSNDHRR